MVPVRPQEVEITAVRAQGAGGQNINKVSNAAHLRFDIRASSLPDAMKQRLLASTDSRINAEGVFSVKAQRFRSLERNREDALARLQRFVDGAAIQPTMRKPTRPTKASQRKRVNEKVRRGGTKRLRRGPVEAE